MNAIRQHSQTHQTEMTSPSLRTCWASSGHDDSVRKSLIIFSNGANKAYLGSWQRRSRSRSITFSFWFQGKMVMVWYRKGRVNSQNVLLTRQNEARFSGLTTFCTMTGSSSSGRLLNVIMNDGGRMGVSALQLHPPSARPGPVDITTLLLPGENPKHCRGQVDSSCSWELNNSMLTVVLICCIR